jgi:cell division protein FtsL
MLALMESGRTKARRDDAHAPVPSRTAALLAWVVGAALVAASLVVLVQVRTAQLKNGYELYALSRAKAQLLEDRSRLEVEVAALKRPDRLARKAAELGLGPARPDQVIRARDAAAGARDVSAEGGEP